MAVPDFEFVALETCVKPPHLGHLLKPRAWLCEY